MDEDTIGAITRTSIKNEELVSAIQAYNFEKIKEISSKIKGDSDISTAIYIMTGIGNLEMVKHLLPLKPEKDVNLDAIDRAVVDGYSDVARCIINYNKKLITKLDYSVLEDATFNGDLDFLKFILPFCNPSENKASALSMAIMAGDVKMVKILAPLSNLEGENGMHVLNRAILGARDNESEIIDIIFDLINVEDNIKWLTKKQHDTKLESYLFEKIKIWKNKNEMKDKIKPNTEKKQKHIKFRDKNEK